MADLGINVIFEGRNLVRILEGLGVTVGISALSVVLSLVLGVFVGLGMRSRWRPLRWLMQLYLEFVRIMPQLVLLFVAYFGLTRVGGSIWMASPRPSSSSPCGAAPRWANSCEAR